MPYEVPKRLDVACPASDACEILLVRGGQTMRSTQVRGALTATCLLTVGCAHDDGVRPCDLWTASAIVSGRVTDSSGAAIVGAAVEVQVAYRNQCPGADDWVRSKQDTTDANGNYSAMVELGNSRGIRCVSVTEVASGTSGLGEAEFAGGCEDTRPPGQLNVDLVIP